MSELRLQKIKELQWGETNDCVVRAISESFGVDYLAAWEFCAKKLKRQPRQGVYTSIYLPKVKQAFGQKLKQLGRASKYSSYKRLEMDCKTKITKTIMKEFIDGNGHMRWKYIDKKYKRTVKREMKVKDFLKKYPKGRFIVTVKAHAFSVVDGVIGGNWDDKKRLTRNVHSAFQIGKI